MRGLCTCLTEALTEGPIGRLRCWFRNDIPGLREFNRILRAWQNAGPVKPSIEKLLASKELLEGHTHQIDKLLNGLKEMMRFVLDLGPEAEVPDRPYYLLDEVFNDLPPGTTI